MIPLTEELEHEAQITARVLERVPGEQLTWKPHPKSMTLGQLALHTAMIPSGIPRILSVDDFEADPARLANPPQPASHAEIMQAFHEALPGGPRISRRIDRGARRSHLARACRRARSHVPTARVGRAQHPV